MTAHHDIGVIFDMDGVLVDSAAPHLKSWELLTAEEGVSVSPQQFAAGFGRQNRDFIPLLFGKVSDERLAALAERKESLYRDLVRDRVPLVPGAVELVRALHERGVRLAVGSSGPRPNVDLVVGAMDAGHLFHALVSEHDVQRGKPDPQVFTLACQRLALDPGRCVVIEDAPAGVQAARAAGTRCIGIPMYHPPASLAAADHLVERLADLTVSAILRLVDGATRESE